MKTIRLFTIFSFIFLGINVSAQLKVESNGEVFFPNGNNINFKGNLQNPGDVVFWDYQDNEMCRIYVLGDEFHIRGDHGGYGGIMMDVSDENVGIQADPDANYEFYVTGNAYATQGWFGSDYRIKENIEYIDKLYSNDLLKLNGASYTIKKDSTNEKLKPEFFTRKRLGFIAQEVQEYYPELVKEDEEGYLAVNYDGFIPILLELIKDQQVKINELEKSISSIKLKGGTLNDGDMDTEINSSKLYQNAPNPFSVQTTIRFEIPESVQKAQLHICNMTGTLLKTIEINQRSTGNVIINANEFNAGMYLYSLVCDGSIVDTKQMLLTD